MLIKEEEELDNKDETKIFNEKVLQVKGINCDIRIAKISYDQLKNSLEQDSIVK